ncbi:MAG: right-handed parallel beta-helix repeat-containing protein [Geminicoccaceae bacterium]|nr:right-handed parallel beta-helix repeat-containing protein [Geminicoccaceae bacterium]
MRSISQVLVLILLSGSAAMAEMQVELKDGRKLTIPFEQNEIAGITVDGKPMRLVDDNAPSRPSATAQQRAGASGLQAGLATEQPTTENGRRILRVGPGREFQLPSEAAAAAQDGDIVEIDAGLYRGDVAGWPQNDIIIRAVGGDVHVDAAGRGFGDKGLWVVSGRNVTIEGIELSGCKVSDHNCAGVRAEGADLTLRDVHFHHNEMGLLVSQDFTGNLLIDRSEFNDNGVDYESYGIQPGHNIYMGRGGRLTVQGSYIHNPIAGHNIKSRADETVILYNRIEDGEGGNGSYQIDISEGGKVLIEGNIIRQGPLADNHSIIAFGAESSNRANSSLELIHNTIINDFGTGIFLRNDSPVVATVVNNLFLGAGELTIGAADEAGNVRVDEAMSLAAIAKSGIGVDKGVEPGTVSGFTTLPKWEYLDPRQIEPRPVIGAGPDAGAHEQGPR